ncbi:MBL fold metallo-hydrolase [Maritalea mediterranea]|uniref:MBL fold metallo-hydrolase n=1 Tax=Maritalea mediterranea TaxID=2909667 RepID=A0ABS9E657_9HYPH|nr:MBL fold metallo-hydrolase [Maritalea mediterranea]
MTQHNKPKIVATILGCGSSGGVPRVGGHWGDCDPNNPKNRRRRCSLLLQGFYEEGGPATNVLIDTGCDIREQLLDAGISSLDAVFYTHEHADHTHGIDDLRVLALNDRKRVDVYASKATFARLNTAFDYCFSAPPHSPYPPILNGHEMEAGDVITIEGEGAPIRLSAFDQEHGSIRSLGFRIGNLAYSCDVSDIPKSSYEALSGLECWIIDALRRNPHPSHFNLEDALHWIEHMKPKRAVLTNMHIDLDYQQVLDETPGHVEPAFDGMQIEIS